MEKEEKDKNQKLLEEIQEKNLKDASGGLDFSGVWNRIAAAGKYVGNTVSNLASKVFSRSENEDPASSEDSPVKPSIPSEFTSEEKEMILDAYRQGKPLKVKRLYSQYFSNHNPGKVFKGTKDDAWVIVSSWLKK